MKRFKHEIHEWLSSRHMDDAALVLRIDDYSMTPLTRGQFVPRMRFDDKQKAIWPSVERAHQAAEWAVKQFGHQYAVFKMVAIVEADRPPIKTTEVA